MSKGFDAVVKVLKKNQKYLSDEDGSLLKNKIIADAYNNDPQLIESLLEEEAAREWFFTQLNNGMLVFNAEKFSWIISNKQLLPDSYTRFTQTIGLQLSSGIYAKQCRDVVISFPFKDCVLQGGQTKTDAKRDEIFFNKLLMPDMIDVMLDPKVLVNPIRHSVSGSQPTDHFDCNDNLIIKGNNLFGLSSLLKRYKGKVKCIYIDPPYYFAAKKSEDTFNYNSNFKLSTWLVFMKNRLELARELLSDDGSIFVQISDDGVAELHVLMKEIFNKNGENNFINKITVKTKSPSGFASVNPGVFESAEYILAFAKNKKNWTYNRLYVKADYDSNYKWFVENRYAPVEEWSIIDIGDAVARELGYTSKSDAIKDLSKKESLGDYAKEYFNQKIAQFAIKNASSVFRQTEIGDDAGAKAVECRERSKKEKGKVFKVERDNHYTIFVYNGREMAFYSNKIRVIDGEESPSIILSNIWMDTPYEGIAREGNVTLKGGKKPEKLIKRIIEMASNEGDLILDFFMGSGTTCAVAHKLKRHYIGIDQLDYGENDAIGRLELVISGDKTGISSAVKWGGGGSFVSCDLAKLNQKFIDEISAKPDDLDSIYHSIINSPYLSEQTSSELLSNNESDFKQLSSEDKIQSILEILSMNELYVNLAEIDDEEMAISDSDKAFNRSFYGEL